MKTIVTGLVLASALFAVGCHKHHKAPEAPISPAPVVVEPVVVAPGSASESSEPAPIQGPAP